MNDIRHRVFQVLARLHGADVDALTLSTPLATDELDIVEALMALEEELGIDLSGDAAAAATIGQAVRVSTIALGRGDPAAKLRSLGEQSLDDGEYDSAVHLLEEATCLDPTAIAGHQLLARALARSRRWDEAAKSYFVAWDGAISATDLSDPELQASFVSMTQGLTQALLESEQAARAVHVATRTLEAVSLPSPDLLYNLACAHARMGSGVAAAAALRQAADIDPGQLEDALHDEDFEPIRNHPDMRRLLD